MKDWASLPLRLALGAVFIAHGLQKAFGVLGGPGIEGFTKMLSGLGLTPAEPLAYAVACIELLGGLCLILGVFTRVASCLLFAVMAVAVLKVHLTKGFFLMDGGYEYNLVIMAACLALLIAGPGKLSASKNF